LSAGFCQFNPGSSQNLAFFKIVLYLSFSRFFFPHPKKWRLNYITKFITPCQRFSFPIAKNPVEQHFSAILTTKAQDIYEKTAQLAVYQSARPFTELNTLNNANHRLYNV